MNAPAPSPFRVRQPFVGLAICAAAGIVSADWQPSPVEWLVWWYPAVWGLALAARRQSCTFLLVVASFHALHSMRLLESPAARLDAVLGSTASLVRAEGIVRADPRPVANVPERFTFPMEVESLVRMPADERAAELPVSVARGARVKVRWVGAPPVYGDRVRVVATARRPEAPRNPAQFDPAAWLLRQGIRTELRVRGSGDAAVIGHRLGHPFLQAAAEVRRWMLGRLALGLEDHPAIRGTVAGIVLGETTDTPEELTEEFRRSGTLHLFAVSGLHVGMFAVLAWGLVRWLPLPRRVRMLLMLPILGFYAAVTGLQASVLRATTMLAVVLGGQILERPSRLLNNLAAAMVGILAVDSHELFDAGFQLSFGVVFAIVLLAGPMARRLGPWFEPDPFVPVSIRTLWERGWAKFGRWLGNACAVSLAAWSGATPLVLYHFHLANPVAVISNLVAIPVSFAVLSLGLLAVAGGLVAPWLAWAFNQANAVAVAVLLGCVRWFSTVPFGWFYLGGLPEPGVEAWIAVLDLGPAQCVVVETGGRTWVMDPGGQRDYERVTLPFLRSRGVDRIEGLVLSHGDVRHIGAAIRAVENFRPRTIVIPAVHDRSGSRRELERHLVARGRARTLVAAGHRLFGRGGLELEVLHPPAGLDRRLADDKGLVLRWRVGGVTMLTVADAGLDTARGLGERGVEAEIVVAGRHPAGPTLEPGWPVAEGTRLVVAGAALFPAAESIPLDWAARVTRGGATLFRQDRTGAVTIRVGGGRVRAEPFLASEIEGVRWEAGRR